VDPTHVVKVLVTGSTGFVAQHLVPSLAARHDVLALGHDRDRIAAAGAEPLELDLRDPGFPAGLPAVDAIVHLAQANVPFPDGAGDLFAVNTASTVALLEHARRVGATRFVLASSASVYGLGDGVRSETDPPRATDFYSATKLAAERFVSAYSAHVGTTILRPVTPYGPGQRSRLIPRLVSSVREGRPIDLNGGGRPRMNPVYVADVVHVIEASLPDDGHRLLNVAGEEPVTIRELANAIGNALGVEPVFHETDAPAPGDIVCDNSRMKELLGDVELVTLAEGLARTVEAA
jgi:UDP-glucose 4-epimerase